MSLILPLNEIKTLLNEQVITDIQLIETEDNLTQLAFYTVEGTYVESEGFDDNQLESVVDFILASKSRLSLGC